MNNLLQRLASEFILPMHDLRYLIRSAPYRYKVYEIPKREPGKTRTIAQPARELKPLQRWIMENVLSKYPIHPSATAYRKGMNIANNAWPHAHHRYLLKMDFKDFFPSIKSSDFEKFVLANPLDASWSEEEIGHLSRMLFWKKKRTEDLRLSIGAPSSPLLSNILLYRFDVMVNELCSSRGVSYTRYADDLTFSTSKRDLLYQIEREIPPICTRLQSPRLRINRDKTIHVSKKSSRRVTGLILTNDGNVSIGRDRKRQVRAAFHKFVLGMLDAKEATKLAGMIAYIKSVEPAYLEKLREKYGAAILNDLFLLNSGHD